MIKEKACKGQSKASGFKGCGKMVNAVTRRFGLCFSCYPKFLLETDAGKIVMEKAIIKASKPRIDFEHAVKQEKEQNSLKAALQVTKVVVHNYVRKRDAGKPCISCNTPYRDDFQAGHYHKAELYETLKFNLDNVNGQCRACNLFKDGNLEQYNINLPLRIGQERFNELQRLAQLDKHVVKVWNIENLKGIRTNIKKLLQELNK